MRVGLVYKDVLREGGYPRDVRWLAGALAKQGIEVNLFYSGGGDNIDGLEGNVDLSHIRTFYKSRPVFDIVHVFGLFIPVHSLVSLKSLRVSETRLVVSPLAQLMPHCIRAKRLKKEIFLKIVCYPWLQHVHGFHVFSTIEYLSVKSRFPRIPSFTASMGVYPSPASIAERVGCDFDECNFLFFGRNDVYQKGLDILLEAFGKAFQYDDLLPAKLTIAGAPWKNSTQYLANSIGRYGLQDRVTVMGTVDEKTKLNLLYSAHYLVYLSRFDGPPRPIREALGVGTPVIVSQETNLGQWIEQYKAGIQVPLDPDRIAHILNQLSSNPEQRSFFAEGAMRLKERLQWDSVAQDYIKGYESIVV